MSDVLRGLVRQLTAAVYVYLAFSIAAHKFGGRPWAWIFEPICVLIGSAIAGRIIEGGWWTSSLVGLFVAAFDLLISFAIGGVGATHWPVIVAIAVGTALVGALGGWTGRRWRSRSQ